MLVEMTMTPENDPEGTRRGITLELSNAEALVLFALLTRTNLHDTAEVRLEFQAEQRLLWNIECLLERQLIAPFEPDYDAQLARARREVQDAGEGLAPLPWCG
jgi:hypothetical protein